MLFLLWFSTTVGEGRLWERLGIYSGKLFIAIKLSKYQIDKQLWTLTCFYHL
jgi:hypothetical protein